MSDVKGCIAVVLFVSGRDINEQLLWHGMAGDHCVRIHLCKKNWDGEPLVFGSASIGF